MRFKPGRSDYVVAHTGSLPNGIYSLNGGASWGSAGGLTLGGNRRIEFVWSQGYTGSGRGVVYALKDSSSRLYRSVNGGVSYSLVSTNTMLGSQGWYDNALKVMPYPRNSSVTDDIVVAGGIDLWRSINGGLSFIKIS